MTPSRLSLLLISLSLVAVGCAQCPDPFAPPSHPVMRLHYPTGLALHPTQPVLFVANSNFDLAYANGSVVATHLGWLVQVLQQQDRLDDNVDMPFTAAALVPSIGGPLAITPDGKHLLHTTRQDNKLVALDVSVQDDGVEISCQGGDGEVPDCTTGDAVYKFPVNDPYGVVVQPEGSQFNVLVSLLRNSDLYSMTLDPTSTGKERLRKNWSRSLGDSRLGASLAVVPGVDGEPDFLMATGRYFPGGSLDVGYVQFMNLWQGQDAPVLNLDLRDQVGALDARGMAISTQRQKAYVITKYPASVVEVDLRRGADGNPVREVTRVGLVGKEPSMVALYEPAHARHLILTASFRDSALVVQDMDSLDVLRVLRDVGDGPFDIVVDHRRGLAFVSCFNDDTVAVVRLPTSPSDNRVMVAARLGLPRDTTQTNPDLPFSTQFPPQLPSLPVMPLQHGAP